MPGGEVRWVEGDSNPSVEPDGSVLWHGWIRDVTLDMEREARLEETRRAALEATRSKTAFLANMGHEIRTPLGAVLGYAELLEQRATDDAPREDLEAIRTIRRNGEHLLGLVNDLLDVSKIDAGKLTIEKIPVHPEQVVSDIVALLRVRAEAKGLELKVDAPTPLPERIQSDPTRLRQILINLVGNAIKFTDEGAVTVRLVMTRGPEPRLVLEVRDTGIGMTPEELDVIRRFEPFTQADASTTRRFGGTGLGLRICACLAERLGDGLEIESTQGVGSLFRVALHPGDLTGVGFRRVSDCWNTLEERAGEAPLAGMRILLADDGLDNRRLISHHLTRAGATVETAENGREAVERFSEDDHAFDAVFMDVMMPEMDGYEATHTLRRMGVAAPIIAITAHAGDEERAACYRAGCDACLTKPVAAQTLVRACLRHTRRSAAA